MTDRERVITVLERAGYIRCDDDGMNWEHPTNVGDGVTLRDDGMAYVTMTVPYGQVPAILSPLTLEAVQTVILDVANEHGQPPGYPSHLHFAMDVLARLRQQMGGEK